MDWLQTLLVRLYSAYFWTVAFVWMGLTVALSAIPLAVGVPYLMVFPVMRWMFAKTISLGGIRVTVHYDPQFDRRRKSVFCANHVNLIDAHVCGAAIPQPFCGLMHAWQLRVPVYGWLMRLSKGIPVDRSRADKVLEAISVAAKERELMGLSILVFPEGRRTPDGRVLKYRRGVFLMARGAGMPVVPVAMRGMYEINRIGSRLFRPGRIEVYVGPQLETEGLDDQRLLALAARMQGWTEQWVEHGHWPAREVAAYCESARSG